jgi:hypothetical protein
VIPADSAETCGRPRSKALRRLLAKQHAGKPIHFRDAWDVCRYRSLIGHPTMDRTPRAMIARAGCVVALIEDTPSAIAPDMMSDIQADLAAGRTVLIMSTTAAVRDHAKAEIINWSGPVRGAA